jgi:hypothetical protein
MDDYTDPNWTSYALTEQLPLLTTECIVTDKGSIVLTKDELELFSEFLEDLLNKREKREDGNIIRQTI